MRIFAFRSVFRGLSIASIGCAAALLAAGNVGAQEKVFRAGAAASNVTPWMGLSISGHMNDRRVAHVHDELFARCIALDDGDTRIAIALVDNCMIPRDVFDSAKRMVTEATGLPADHLLTAATHTHSGPCTTGVFQSGPDTEYNLFLTRRIAEGIVRAVNNLEPARIGWGAGSLPGQVFNRRWLMKEGAALGNPFGGTDKARMNPPRASEELVEPAGPTDPEVPILSIQSKDGRPIALLANYALHYVGGMNGTEVSADYFGAFSRMIEKKLSTDGTAPPFVAMLSNGTSGDINNINFREPGIAQQPYEQINIVAGDLAAEVFRVYEAIAYQDWVKLGALQEELTFAVRKPNSGDLDRARAILAEAEGPEYQGLEAIYAHESVLLESYPPEVALLVQTLQIGDAGIAAMPCEVFVAFGLELKEKSPFPRTFTIELANGYNGYLPTAAQHKLGGYETWRARSSYLEEEAGHRMVETLLGLFGKLKS